MDTILANYAVTEWMEDAKKEAEILPDFEVGTYIAELDWGLLEETYGAI